MNIDKITAYTLVCPNCGSKIMLSAEEYEKYKKETDGYGNSILCTEEDKDGNSYEINYINFDCPNCGHYIPVTVADLDMDRFGFVFSKYVTPFYGDTVRMTIEDYLAKRFAEDENLD